MKGINFSSVLAVATLLASAIAADVDPIVIKVSAESYTKAESRDVDVFAGFRDRSFSIKQTGQNCKHRETRERDMTEYFVRAALFEALHINVRCPILLQG